MNRRVVEGQRNISVTFPTAVSKLLLLATWLSVNLGTTVGATGATTSVSEPKTRHARPVSHVTRLQVNTENLRRLVTTGVSEADGHRSIQSILLRSRFEEMWAYVPAAGDSGPGQWHEIGRDEKSGAEDARVRVDWDYLALLMADSRELSLYHFHPLAYFDCVDRAACARRPGSHESPAPADAQVISNLIFAMPSPADIHFMMETTWQFRQRHPDGGVIRHRVVTPHGTVEYGLTEAGFAKYASDRGARSQGLYIKWVAASRLDEESVRTLVDEAAGDFAIALQRLVESLNTRYLSVTHIPAS